MLCWHRQQEVHLCLKVGAILSPELGIPATVTVVVQPEAPLAPSAPRWRRTAVTCFTFVLRSCLEVCTCPPAGQQPSHRMLSEPCLEEVCERAGGRHVGLMTAMTSKF